MPKLICHPQELNQVFLNLIVNSAHSITDKINEYSNTYGTILISSSLMDDIMKITIEDNGNGMAKHIQDNVLDAFFTTKKRGKGTGQGLAIARGVIEDKHQGQISFTSRLGVGTVFTVLLPLKVQEQHNK